MSRKGESTDIPFQGKVRGQKSRIHQGQPFVRHDPIDSINGVTSPERKSGRKYETFVMTGDKIIRTTSEQNDSDPEKKVSGKNKEPPVDNVIKPMDNKKKKIDHSRSKIPKPSSIGSPKIPPKNIPNESPVISPIHSPKVIPKLINKDSCKKSKTNIYQNSSGSEISPQSSPKNKKKDSPKVNQKQITCIPQKVSKVPVKEGTEKNVSLTDTTQLNNLQQNEHHPLDVSNTQTAANNVITNVSMSEKEQSQNKLDCENTYNGETIHSSATKSQLPTLPSSSKQLKSIPDSIPFGYNNQAYIKQMLTEKRSPFDEIQKPVYHTCAEMPIELDIPPDDICSDDEHYNRMDDEIDMDNLPPPPAELLQDFEEKYCEDNNVENTPFFIQEQNHVFQREEQVYPSSQQMPTLPYAYEQRNEQSLGSIAINYSAPIQENIGTKVNSVMNSALSDSQNIAGNIAKDNNVIVNENKIIQEQDIDNKYPNNIKVERDGINSFTEPAITIISTPLTETPATASTYNLTGSIATSHIPHLINSTLQQNENFTHSAKLQSKNQSLILQQQVEENKHQYDNKNTNKSGVDLHSSDINTIAHKGLNTNNDVLIQHHGDLHEDFLDNVLESETPMDMSFNIPTPPSERDNQNLVSNKANTSVNKNLSSNNKNVSNVSKLDYLYDAATKLKNGDINGDYSSDRDAFDIKESLANMQDEPRRGMVTSLSGENFGYKTLPSKSTPSHGVGCRDPSSGRNQSPALVRNSKSHENYLDDKDMTMIDIDFGDNIASSVDALHYDQSCTSLDKFNGYSHVVSEQSKSLENSPERRYEKFSDKVHMPTFFSIEEPRSITKLREGMKVKEMPKRDTARSSTSSSEVSPTHETFIPEEPSPTYEIKSEGSSPSHEYIPFGSDSGSPSKINAIEKSKKHKRKSKTGSSNGEKNKKNISKSADNSPAHYPRTKLPSFDSTICAMEKNMEKEIPMNTSDPSSPLLNYDLKNVDGHLPNNKSHFHVQDLRSEPRSPRKTNLEASKQGYSSNNPNDKENMSQVCVQKKENTLFNSDVTSYSKVLSHSKHKKNSQIHVQHDRTSAHHSPSKYKSNIVDNNYSRNVNQNKEQYLGKFEENDVPPPPYSLVEPVEHLHQQQPSILISNSNKSDMNSSSYHSPTKSVQTVCSPHRDSGHKLDASHIEPVPSSSGPSSPDSDTGSIYHQPLKDVDVPSAQRLAKRLFELEGFKKKDISKHLSKKNDFAQQVGEEFLKYFDFTDEGLDVSLRKFLKHITLAGETQERERVLVHFSKRYMECNPESFNSEDAAHTLTCALLLLNTDLHGQNVGQKMSLAEFIENLSDLNDGENFPKEVLKNMYHSIKSEALEWEFDEDSEGLTQDFDLIQTPGQRALPPEPQKYLGHNPFLDIPDPDKTTEYKKGFVMRKCCIDPDGRKTAVGKRGWKMFYGVLKDMILYLYKDEHAFKKVTHYDSMSNAIRAHHALATKATDYKKKQHVLRLQTADSAEYLLQTSNPDECQSWIDNINLVAAVYSAPPLPGAVGSQKKFQRPLMPASYTRFNVREQYQHHEQKVVQIERELKEHRKYPPEKGSKSRVIQDYIEKEQYLQFELRRFKTYCYQLQIKLAAYPELEPSLVETAICEVSEPPSPNTEQKNSEESPLASASKSPTRTDRSKATSPKEREKKSRSVGRSQSDRMIREKKHKSLPESVLMRYRPSFDNPHCYGTAV